MLTFKESPNVGVLLICSLVIDAISSFFASMHSAVHKARERYTRRPRITRERIDRLILSRSMHRVIIHDQLASFRRFGASQRVITGVKDIYQEFLEATVSLGKKHFVDFDAWQRELWLPQENLGMRTVLDSVSRPENNYCQSCKAWSAVSSSTPAAAQEDTFRL